MKIRANTKYRIFQRTAMMVGCVLTTVGAQAQRQPVEARIQALSCSTPPSFYKVVTLTQNHTWSNCFDLTTFQAFRFPTNEPACYDVIFQDESGLTMELLSTGSNQAFTLKIPKNSSVATLEQRSLAGEEIREKLNFTCYARAEY